jgi:hypothetical protein
VQVITLPPLSIFMQLTCHHFLLFKEMEFFDGRNQHLSAAEAANGQPKTVTDSILVGPGNAPCILHLNFENKNPWTLQLSYSVRVIAPSMATIIEGRRNRATSALRYLDSDMQALEDRQSCVANERRMIEEEISQIQQQIQQRVDSLGRPGRRDSSPSRREGLRSNVWPPDNNFNP